MDIGDWLRSLGLEQYEAAFRDNAITGKVLPNLTADDLKDLGVGMVGHRRTLLDAIAYLRGHANAKASPSEAPSPLSKPAQETAERRQVTVMFSDLVGSTARRVASTPPHAAGQYSSANMMVMTRSVTDGSEGSGE